ncbi:hypothetical protein ACFVMC_00190 [Nocardia sp. NPDC127579]|uniref:hypothetical protein n=1 Tax=Nocardia sp. NPDC127579 TaxID=3345402 RepID=UPI0036306E89
MTETSEASAVTPVGTNSSRRRLRLLQVVLVITVVLFVVLSVFGEKIMDAVNESDPAADAPPDLCAAIGTTLFERLVPDGVADTETNYSTGRDARCAYRTADGSRSSTSDTYGFLEVRLLRHGRFAWKSRSDVASEAFVSACGNTKIGGKLQGEHGLGDEACTAYTQDGATAIGSAVIRRGADLFWVDYYTHPGSGPQVRSAMTEVVSASLAGTS